MVFWQLGRSRATESILKKSRYCKAEHGLWLAKFLSTGYARRVNPAKKDKKYWSVSREEALTLLGTTETGLSESEAQSRVRIYGSNTVHTHRINAFTLLLRQLSGNPLTLLLLAATIISFFLGEQTSSFYIVWLIFISVALGFWNEWSAERTIDALMRRITHTALVIRNGEKKEIPVLRLTIGDVVILSRGVIIPADVRFIETKNLEVNESPLTGESEPVVKEVHEISAERLSITEMKNIGFMGTAVQNGSGVGVVIAIGKETEYASIADSGTFLKPTTEFQKGLAGFGNLIIKFVLVLTAGLFLISALAGHDRVSSLLFALAIAVGLTPELLPVIVTVSLSHGAGRLAKKHILTKRLLSIENLGNMDVLCADKTGTLTEGKIQLVDFLGSDGKKDSDILTFGLMCNSAVHHHKIIGNSIDVALWEYALKFQGHSLPNSRKIFEEPFDYEEQAMFTVLDSPSEHANLILKGAPEVVFSRSISYRLESAKLWYKKLSEEGYRVIAIATKPVEKRTLYSWKDTKHMVFQGFLTFLDTPKKTARNALDELEALSVDIKIVTGDSEIITRKICADVDIPVTGVLTGNDIVDMSDGALQVAVKKANIFARVRPNEKLRIIRALQRNGHTVGYLGDGINDVPALHNADVGITVNTAVDVAKEAASIILLRQSLDVIDDGIIEGRKTFQNTIKYILMASSSNFGNMFSASIASFFLPFFPMAPLQILLANSIYDVSQMTLPSDNVDPEALLKPRHWNIAFIKRYMLFFGPLSSIFDFLTFGVLWWAYNARGALFQTGWFIESVATQILVVFIIRTSRRPFFFSKPSNWLVISSLTMIAVAILLPFSPLAMFFGFRPLAGVELITLFAIVVVYLLLVEFFKVKFLKRV